jgi:hypothetical protein
VYVLDDGDVGDVREVDDHQDNELDMDMVPHPYDLLFAPPQGKVPK